MGHPKFKFETILMTLSCGPQGPGISGGTKGAPELKTLNGQPKDPPLKPQPLPDTGEGLTVKNRGFPVLDLGKALSESLTAVKSTLTYCFELAHEFLKSQSGNFTRTEMFFDTDGLVVQYHCSRDDRTYTVKITASK